MQRSFLHKRYDSRVGVRGGRVLFLKIITPQIFRFLNIISILFRFLTPKRTGLLLVFRNLAMQQIKRESRLIDFIFINFAMKYPLKEEVRIFSHFYKSSRSSIDVFFFFLILSRSNFLIKECKRWID